MLVSISGSQGSGKSTVLNELKKLGYPVIERKTARSVLGEWDMSLDTVNADADLKQAFQMELVRRKYTDEMEQVLSSKIFFTERTFSDVFTYSLISFGQYNDYDKWLNKHYNTCKDNCQSYHHVFYLNKFSDIIEDDGVRSINKFYSQMVDSTMFNITSQMIPNEKLSIINSKSIERRVEMILKVLEL